MAIPAHRISSRPPKLVSRRSVLGLVAGVTAAAPLSAWSQAKQALFKPVRAATGLRATWQSTTWLGAEAGIFKKYGVDMALPAVAVGGPEAGAGIVRGDWEFAHTGALVVAEEVLKGRDLVILATPTEEFPNSFIMTRKEITELAQLSGKKVGVLTETGQTSVTARLTIEKTGARAMYLALGKFDRIFAALAAGDIDAGALPSDLRFSGQDRYGWKAFPLNEFGTPSVFATSRRLIAADRNLVMNVMRGFIETIHLFKTRPDVVVPLLQRYLNIENLKAARDLYAFHAQVFRKVPSPLLTGMPKLREFLAKTYSGADTLKEADIADPSFTDDLEKTGFIDRLYAA